MDKIISEISNLLDEINSSINKDVQAGNFDSAIMLSTVFADLAEAREILFQAKEKLSKWGL